MFITAFVLGSCDEAKLTYDLYNNVEPEEFTHSDNSWFIFLRPIDSRLMILPSSSLATRYLVVSKASFGLIEDEDSFSKNAEFAALEFIQKRLSETCAIDSQLEGFAPKFEFTYYCD